jgi:predicted hydrocarbon binding protein
MSQYTREQLGNFSSVICLKAIITGMESSLGEKATAISLIAAGRERGRNLVKELGLTDSNTSLSDVSQKLAIALGSEGTRLLILDRIEQEGGAIKAYVRETVCSAGEESGSPRKCTFTLGAVWGALESILGKKFRGKQTESVLRGGTHDVFEFTELIASKDRI